MGVFHPPVGLIHATTTWRMYRWRCWPAGVYWKVLMRRRGNDEAFHQRCYGDHIQHVEDYDLRRDFFADYYYVGWHRRLTPTKVWRLTTTRMRLEIATPSSYVFCRSGDGDRTICSLLDAWDWYRCDVHCVHHARYRCTCPSWHCVCVSDGWLPGKLNHVSISHAFL